MGTKQTNNNINYHYNIKHLVINKNNLIAIIKLD